MKRVNDTHEDSYDESDDGQQMMTVTLTPDVEAVNTVSSSTSRYEHQIYATLLVKGIRGPPVSTRYWSDRQCH